LTHVADHGDQSGRIGLGLRLMNPDAIDWTALERLRAAFLAGTAGATDYWQCASDLASYDATFAQRIGWKWDYVLAELAHRGWTPPRGGLLDWGCGSGIAARAFLDHFGTNAVSALYLWDRSPLAMSFAAGRAKAKYPTLEVKAVPDLTWPRQSGAAPTGTPPFTLLISHVLTELSPEQSSDLADFAAEADAVLWVEPGTREASRALIALREWLRERFHVVAPCVHQARCGMLAPENEPHWCHHFAPSPAGLFTDGGWTRFAKLAGLDLRSLPLSFLVLDKRPAPSLPPGATRVIGRPRVYKPHALLLGCNESGVRERKLAKRALPEAYDRCKKENVGALQIWDCNNDEIRQIRPFAKIKVRDEGTRL